MKQFESTRVVLNVPQADNPKGSVKWDSADDLKRGIPLITFPSFYMDAPHEPTSGAGHKTASLSDSPITAYLVYDKTAARVLTPLVQGENLKQVVITETGRADDAQEVKIRSLTMTDPFLVEVMWYWDDSLFTALTPGGVVALSFKYTRVDLLAQEFDPVTGQAKGQKTNGFDKTHSASVS